MSYIWHFDLAQPWIRYLGSQLLPRLNAGTATSDLPTTAYFGYGKLTLIIYLSLYLGSSKLLPLLGARTLTIYRYLLLLALTLDFHNYWLSEWSGVGARTILFWYGEFPLLIFLVLLLTISAFCSHTKTAIKLRWLPVVLIITTAAIEYFPHSLLISIFWAQQFFGPTSAPNEKNVT